MEVAYVIVAFIVGFLFAVAICKVSFKSPPNMGDLLIYTADSDGPYMFLELDKSPQDVMNQRDISLRVVIENKHIEDR